MLLGRQIYIKAKLNIEQNGNYVLVGIIGEFVYNGWNSYTLWTEGYIMVVDIPAYIDILTYATSRLGSEQEVLYK